MRVISLEQELSNSRKETYLSLGAKLEDELSQELSLKLQQKFDTELKSLQVRSIRIANAALEENLDAMLEKKLGALAETSSELAAQPIQTENKTLQNHKMTEGENIINAKLRSEIELYIEQDLDALVISNKTGVPLNLVEIMVSMKNRR